jgi:hypothetical protein
LLKTWGTRKLVMPMCPLFAQPRSDRASVSPFEQRAESICIHVRFSAGKVKGTPASCRAFVA